MRNAVTFSALLVLAFGCSAPDKLEIPPIPGPPDDWNQFSISLITGSDCPSIEGTYSEPPIIYRSGKKKKHLPTDNLGLYSGYVPFHRADRKVLAASALNISRDSFVIRQPDPSQFYFSMLNHEATAISEYHFRADEGDFECLAGHIKFPNYTSYGMIEGRSFNFQIRNVLLKDETGALVIQSSRGPYRGKPSKAKNDFMFEFFRYPLKGGGVSSKIPAGGF